MIGAYEVHTVLRPALRSDTPR